jgi:hypothetical protein
VGYPVEARYALGRTYPPQIFVQTRYVWMIHCGRAGDLNGKLRDLDFRSDRYFRQRDRNGN